MAIDGVYVRYPTDIIFKILHCLQRWRSLLGNEDRERLDAQMEAIQKWVKAFADNKSNEAEDGWTLD